MSRWASRSNAGELRIDFAKRTVAPAAASRCCTTFVEFEILGMLAAAPGRVFRREALLERIWGDSAYRDPRTIDVHIRHLREKIEQRPRRSRSTSSRCAASATASATPK